MHSDKEKDSLQELFDRISINTNQLAFDFDDNMNGHQAQPALTISSGSVDTISLGAVGSSASTGIGGGYNFQYDYNNTLNSGYTITTGTGSSGLGSVLTNGTNGLTFSDWGTPNSGLKVNGDAEFDGDVKIKGKSITETLEKIEEKLAILHPNEELESKWNELRELRNRYIELEKEIIEKEKMWDILKK